MAKRFGYTASRHRGGRIIAAHCLLLAGLGLPAPAPADGGGRNVILFVPDGLRAGIVDASTAPNFSALRDAGVNFVNSHSLYPTFTTANASAFATGHRLGDTGDFSNTIDVGFAVKTDSGTRVPFLESDAVLREIDGNPRYAGNYLHEESILHAAQKDRKFLTASVGKLGPVAIQSLTRLAAGEGADDQTIVIDDRTGTADGVDLPPEIQDTIAKAKLSAAAPTRGDNGRSGDARTPGTLIPNYAQQQYFLEMTIRIVLPYFRDAKKNFVLVYWSRDPDGTQHNQGDSLQSVVPGINGPTSMSAIRAADGALGAIRQSLKELGLEGTTDIVVAADHGFSTISKESRTSLAVAATPGKHLPPGFVAMDLADALNRGDPDIRMFEPKAPHDPIDWKAGANPSGGSALIGRDAEHPDLIVAANGGSDLLYLDPAKAKDLAPKVIEALLAQDYVSGLFTDTETTGEIAGTLPLTSIGLKGSALPSAPSIVVNFKSFVAPNCPRKSPALCSVIVADSTLQQGQGMHGSFSRGDTWNFMAAIGPDFRTRYRDPMPASNADVGMTIAKLLGLQIPAKGTLTGRVLEECLVGGKEAKVAKRVLRSKPTSAGLRTILVQQAVGDEEYNDVAGFPGRTVGLDR